ncbi:carboxylesterase [Rhizobium sp. Root708]|nr:carboxylesterase [Rhizobium sp. Root708]
MKTVRALLVVGGFSIFGAAGVSAAEPVTVDNFTRAESDLYFGNAIKDAGGPGVFHHRREPMQISHQVVIRANRDTLYSSAVFDLDAGPVTLTMPDPGNRFMSLMAINEDHYVVGDIRYGAGSYTYDKNAVGTRYMLIGIRTLVIPDDADDVETVHKLQEQIKVDQPGGKGAFDIPTWDDASQKKVRDALLVLGSTIPDFRGAFGSKETVNPIRHLIGTALGWGGNPDKDAFYLNVTPPQNDGKTVYDLTVKDVPVDGFWSISVYNAEGYFEANELNAYTLNNITAKKEPDSSVKVQFGACDGKVENCIPIANGWNYTVRLYRPRQELLDGRWTFPEPIPVAR